ncbi:hypothetical protein [Pendulispora albinea]|uniref:Uncharacterized protein n=1 Tax=Pendulispora albinea TaxID=2741071 RepID=A0ABZ2LYY4_9BACT
MSIGSSSCTLAFRSNEYQCSTDFDCTSRGSAFQQTVCSQTDGVCVDVNVAGCTSNEKCTAENNGAPHICKKPGSPCVPVFTAECNTLIPHDAKMKDNAVLFAFTGLKTGSESDAQKISYNMIEMGVNELNRSLVGLPGGPNGIPRPIIGVECDESQVAGEPDNIRLLHSYDHIVKDLGIQGIITNAYSSITVNIVVPQYVVPNGIFLMPNLSLSPLISSLDDQGLVWRSISPTPLQAPAQAAIVQLVEAKIRAATNPPMSDPIKVALVTSTGVVFSSTGDSVQAELHFNGGKNASQNAASDHFRKFSHTSSNDDAGVDLSKIANDLLEYHPHIIVATNKGNDFWEAEKESPKGIAPAIERQWVSRWGTSSYKPIYVIASPTIERATAYLALPAMETKREELRQRIVAVDYAPWNARMYNDFLLNYRAAYTDPKEDPVASGLNNYVVEYDSVYSMIYAMFAAAQKNPTRPLTGKAIAEAMPRLLTGDPFNVGPTDVAQIKQRLAAGQSVNLNGLYSLLDYDLSTGDSPTETSVVCLDKSVANPGSYEWKFSMTWDRNAHQLVGDKTGCASLK